MIFTLKISATAQTGYATGVVPRPYTFDYMYIHVHVLTSTAIRIKSEVCNPKF